MEKIIKISLDVIELDRENMLPILRQHGQNFNEKEILIDIAKFNPGLYNMFCHYSKDDILMGYFRFNFDSDKNIIIKSFQLRSSVNYGFTLRLLLYIAYRQLILDYFSHNPKIYAWVNTSNKKSINLLEKLSFKYEKGHSDASMFSSTKDEIIAKIESIGIHLMFSQESHPGQFPIRVLRHNIPQTLTTHKEGVERKLKELINDGKINPKIECEISNNFGLIKANGITKQVIVSEQFLAFLWSFIYSTFVIIEEGVQEKIIKSGSNLWDGKIDESSLIVKRAQQLYLWSRSLPSNFSKWSLYLPNPEVFYSAEEQFYINKVNGIYLTALTYLINHEFAHLINNHIDTLAAYNLKGHSNLTEDEKNVFKMIEGEADQYAREEMVKDDDDEKTKFYNGLSIILAHCASLFAISHPSMLKANVHPDIDNRLFHSINSLNMTDLHDRDYIDLVGAISLNLFFSFNKIEIEKSGYVLKVPREIGNPKEYLSECFKIIDDIKENY